MSEQTLSSEIEILVQEILGINQPIAHSANLLHMGMESIGFVSVIIHLERTYKTNFTDKDMMIENFSTISNITQITLKRGSFDGSL